MRFRPAAVHVEVLLFLACNGVAAAFNFGSRLMLSRVLSYPVAIVVAYLFGMVTAFILSRTIVFRATEGSVGQQMGWFVLVNVAAVIQTLLVSLLFARALFPALAIRWHPETVAHAFGIAVPAVSSYLGHKHLSFRKP